VSIPVAVGDILAGKYQVERILGSGGMGVVVAARHIHLDERVAIKFLLPEAAKKPTIVARFLREGRAASKIKSEHVARVYDVGTLEAGLPYIVMEYLEGSDLAAIVKQLGPLPVEEAVEHILQACEALAEAHMAGIIHRDLKPGNLFLTTRADGSPAVKVIDFGISKVAEKLGEELEITGTLEARGSPLFMSPEQMVSTRDVDQRSDIWSLGIALFHLLTGEYPFQAATMPQICGLVLTAEPRRLLPLRPDAPPELEQVVLCCLQKDPKDRFQSVAELAQALCEFAPPHARISADRAARVVGGGGAKRASQTSRPAINAAASAPAPRAPGAPGQEGGKPRGPEVRSIEQARAEKMAAQQRREKGTTPQVDPAAPPRDLESSGVRRLERAAARPMSGSRLRSAAGMIDTSTPSATVQDPDEPTPRKRASPILAAGVAGLVMLVAAAAAALAILRPEPPGVPAAPSAAPSSVVAAPPPSSAGIAEPPGSIDRPADPIAPQAPGSASKPPAPATATAPVPATAPVTAPAPATAAPQSPVAAPTPTRSPPPPRPPAPTAKPKPPGDDLFNTPK
jgi:serine/threonine-protein kinase